MTDNRTENVTKHRMIEEELLEQIESGELAIGRRVASGGKVAQKYGVSLPTADKALTNLVTRGYLERTPGRGTYVTNWLEKVHNGAQVDSIAVICTDDDISFYSKFMRDASQEAERNGYHVVFTTMGSGDDCAVPLIIRKNQALGSLVLGRMSQQQAIVLAEQNVPHLLVGNHRNTFGQASVCYDVEDAAYQITTKLLGLEHGSVWLVIQPTIDVYYSQELLDGYQCAIFERPEQTCSVHFSRRNLEDYDYQILVERMIASGEERFCMVVSYNHVGLLVQHLDRAGVGMDRTTIVVVGDCERDWAHKDRTMLCDNAASLLAKEGVRQIIDLAQEGSPITGKKFKLRIKTVDDRAKPFEFSWR